MQRFEGPFHHSDIQLYLTCPRIFYYEKILGIAPEYATAAAIFGTAVHRVIEDVHSKELSSRFHIERSLKERLNEVVDETELPIMWRGEYDKRFSEAVEYLFRYSLANFNRNASILASERRFKVEIGRYAFEGQIDQVRGTSQELLILVEYKSGDYRPDKDFLKRSYQLSIYAYAVWKIYGKIPDEIWLYHLKDHLPYKRRQGDSQAGEERGPAVYKTNRSEQDLIYLEKDLARVCQAIRFNMFYRSPAQWGSCNGFCRFKEFCLGEIETPEFSEAEMKVIEEAIG